MKPVVVASFQLAATTNQGQHMGIPHDPFVPAYQKYLDELIAARLLIPLGVPGVYGRSGVFESVVEHFEAFITRAGAHLKAEVMKFPPVFARKHYCCIDHMENFPNLMGSVHTFDGSDREHMALLAKKGNGEDWSRDLVPADVRLVPAACYPLYPTATRSEEHTSELQSRGLI